MMDPRRGSSTPKRPLKSPVRSSKRQKAAKGNSSPAEGKFTSASTVGNCQQGNEYRETDICPGQPTTTCSDAPVPAAIKANEQDAKINSKGPASAAGMANGKHLPSACKAACQEQNSSSSQDARDKEGSSDNNTNYGKLFPSQVFDTRDELISWVRNTGRENSMAIIIKSSIQGIGPGRGTVWLGCERGGKRRCKRKGNMGSERRTGSKKCQCPFSLRGSELSSGSWVLHVQNESHNHELIPPEGHSYMARLTEAELKLITDLTKKDVKPKEILMQMKGANEKTNSTMTHIYNARQKLKTLDASGRLILQQHLNSINDHRYHQFHRRESETNLISELLFAHPKSVDLLRAFPYVLIMDCAYKSRKHDMPFLEVYGVASTDQNFPVAFAYLKCQQEDSYAWALQNIRSFFESSRLPVAIVTCSDLALMKTVENVFPESTHLLCRKHILKDVELNCIQLSGETVAESFISRWKALVEAQNEQQYSDFLFILEQDYKEFPQVLSYVKDTWLIPYKEKIVSAWTDQTLHFGAHLTDRVKGAYARLKRYLDPSKRISWAMWRDIDILIELQLMDIKTELERSPTTFPSFALSKLYGDLIGRVPCGALKLIESECKRAKEIGSDGMTCGCYLRYTHGLPCAHELYHIIANDQSIPVSAVNPFWTIVTVWESDQDFDPMAVWQSLLQEVLTKPLEEQKRLANEMHRLVKEEATTSMTHEDLQKPICMTRGQPIKEGYEDLHPNFTQLGLSHEYEQFSPKSNDSDEQRTAGSLDSSEKPLPPFIDDIPSFMVPYVDSWDDVLGDGNCGYRAIAKILLLDAEKWPLVRRDLFHEVCSRRELYAKVICCENVQTVLNGIAHWQGPAPRPHWMSMPDIGYAVATRYNIAFVCLSKSRSLTFMPLTASSGVKPPDRVVTVAFLDRGNHYIALHMLEESPMPPLLCSWHSAHDASVDKWDAKFFSRFKKYTQFRSSAGLTRTDLEFSLYKYRRR